MPPIASVDRRVRTRRAVDRDVDQSPDLREVLELLRTSRPNVLMVDGPDRRGGRLLSRVQADLRAPRVIWEPRRMPQVPTGTLGTLIIRRVDQLNVSQQDHLLHYLDESHGGIQVVSIAAASLFPRVARGVFSEGLYYRLNIVLFDPGQFTKAPRRLLR